MTKDLDVTAHNEKAWDLAVATEDCWTTICSEQEIEQARRGHPPIVLTPNKPVPLSWLGDLRGIEVLGLAAGGGQQGPLLAAAGGHVTIADFSAAQLGQDRKAAERYGLRIECIKTTADDLSTFPAETFDLIVNPCSNCFFPDLAPVWRECHRVLKPNGRLMYGCINPVCYQFDFEKANQGHFELKYPQPYSDANSLSPEEKARFIHIGSQYEFGHTLTDQIGRLLQTGFVMLDFYEDTWGPRIPQPIDRFMPQYLSILAQKSTPR